MTRRIDLATYVARRVEVRRRGDQVEVIYSESAGVQAVLRQVATVLLTPDQARALSANLLLVADGEAA